MTDFGNLNYGEGELERYAHDMAAFIASYDELGNNANSAYTVTAFQVATVDGKYVGTVSAGDDGIWSLVADKDDSVKREELAAAEAEFEASGGRGVELADRIDALRADLSPESATCRHCGRIITWENGAWVDPNATGDDAVWRETCDSHDTFTAEHEPDDEIETIEGIEVNSAAFSRAPLPVNCMGTSDDEDCHDDPTNPCRACFLYDDDAGRSRFWDREDTSS